MPAQETLSLSISARTVLVTTETAGAVLGVDTETVIACAERRFNWVWDVSVKGAAGEIRELRFWAREIIAPESVGTLSRQQVLRLILGERQNFHPGEVGLLLCITRPTRLELTKQGDLARQSGSQFYTRASLENFLNRRLIHQAQP